MLHKIEIEKIKFTPLSYAIFKEKNSVIKLLVIQFGKELLTLSIESEDLEILHLLNQPEIKNISADLLSQKTFWNYSELDKLDPVSFAAYKGKIKSLNFFLRNLEEIERNTRNYNYYPPLYAAVLSKNPQVVKGLLFIRIENSKDNIGYIGHRWGPHRCMQMAYDLYKEAELLNDKNNLKEIIVKLLEEGGNIDPLFASQLCDEEVLAAVIYSKCFEMTEIEIVFEKKKSKKITLANHDNILETLVKLAKSIKLNGSDFYSITYDILERIKKLPDKLKARTRVDATNFQHEGVDCKSIFDVEKNHILKNCHCLFEKLNSKLFIKTVNSELFNNVLTQVSSIPFFSSNKSSPIEHLNTIWNNYLNNFNTVLPNKKISKVLIGDLEDCFVSMRFVNKALNEIIMDKGHSLTKQAENLQELLLILLYRFLNYLFLKLKNPYENDFFIKTIEFFVDIREGKDAFPKNLNAENKVIEESEESNNEEGVALKKS